MIEVWEWLDCETVGTAELHAIGEIVQQHYGPGAVTSPASLARLLADEGAELRHAEVLEMDVNWRAYDKYAPMLRNVLRFSNLAQAEQSLRDLENLRQHFTRQNDSIGLHRLRELAQTGRKRAQMIAGNVKVAEGKRAEKAEIAEWFRIWLSTPTLFADWLDIRRNTADFRAQFLMPPEAGARPPSA